MSILKNKKTHLLISLALIVVLVVSLIIPGSIGAGAVDVLLFDGSGDWSASSDGSELLSTDGSAWAIFAENSLPEIKSEDDNTYISAALSVNQFDYELSYRYKEAGAAGASVSGGTELCVDIKLDAPEELYSATYGSMHSINEGVVTTDSWVTANKRALGIYFYDASGNCISAGVLQKDFKSALKTAYTDNAAGSWVTLSLPITGTFGSDDAVKTVYFDFGKASKTGASCEISIDNIRILGEAADDNTSSDSENTDTDDKEENTSTVINREYLTVLDSWKTESTTQWGGVLQVGNAISRICSPENRNPDEYSWTVAVDGTEGAYASLVIPQDNWDYELYTRNGYGTDALSTVSLEGVEYILMRVRVNNKAALKPEYFSKFILDVGRQDSGTYDGTKALGVSISGKLSEGRDVNSIYTAGVTQYDLYNALNAVTEGEWTTLVLPITGSFEADSVAKYVFFDISKGFNEALKLDIRSISFANSDYLREQGMISEDVELKLENAPDYSFSDAAWYPQLAVPTASAMVNSSHKYIKLDIKIGDIATVLENLKAGSKGTTDGSEMSYGLDSALGIYFSGTDVSGIGVTQNNLFNALRQYEKTFKADGTASLYLPLTGEFSETSVITGFNMMLTHGNSNLKDITVSIDNVVLTSTAPAVEPDDGDNSGDDSDDGEEAPDTPSEPSTSLNDPDDGKIILKNGSDYSFSDAAWYPQLVLNTESENAKASYKYLKLDLKLGDVETIIANFKAGSRGTTDGAEMSYGLDSALGIYFNGTDINGIGISQNNLFSAITEKKDNFKNGETVTLTLPITGSFKDSSVITGINMMLTHGNGNLNGIAVSVSNITLLANASSDSQGDGASSGSNISDDGIFTLTEGKDYSFTSAEWYPQLRVEVEPESITSKDYVTLSMDIACKDIYKIIENISISSRACASEEQWSKAGGWSDGDGTPLKIYFAGTDVNRIGVDVTSFRNALQAYADDLAAGKTVTVDFALTNGKLFTETSVITGINFMPTHSANAANIGGVKISISNARLLKTASSTGGASTAVKWAENVIFSGEEGKWQNKGKVSSALEEREVVSLLSWGDPGCSVQVLTEGNNSYINAVSSEHMWNPDFWIKTSNEEYDLKGVGYIQLDIQLTNPGVLINAPFFSDGSASLAAEYGGGAYYIYFNSDGSKQGIGVGVTQTAFRAALTHYKADLEAGKWVTIELPIDDPSMLETAVFDQIVFKYGKGLSEPVTVKYDNIKFMKGASTAEYAVSSNKSEEETDGNAAGTQTIVKKKSLTAGDITSTLDNIVIDFAAKKIYVAEGSIVRDLHTYIELSDSFSKSIRFEGQNMANRSKVIEGESFDYVVIDADGNETVFRIITCPVDEEGKIIIPSTEEDVSAGGNNWLSSIDWKLILMVLASVIAGAALMLLIELIRNKKFVLFKKA